MAETAIQWTDHSINPIRARNRETGAIGHFCEKISPGCAHCYAALWNLAPGFKSKAFGGTSLDFLPVNRPKVELFLDQSKLDEVLRRRKPTKWFWCDMTDLFGEWVPDEWLHRCFEVMERTPHHTHQVLTKRAERMAGYVGWRWGKREDGPGHRIPARNVWLGISAEDQPRLDDRYEWLVRTPAAVRFISYEPALGPIDAATWFHSSMTNAGKCAIDWLIAGGESGPGCRPCGLHWIRSIRDQCRGAGVACFIKQLGGNPVFSDEHDATVKQSRLAIKHKKGGNMDEWPADLLVRQWPREVDHA